MSGLFGGGSRNRQPNRLGSIQVQTSEFGVSIPVLLGTNLVSPKLIDYVNFHSIATQQGGKGGGGVSGYEYYAAVLLLLSKATQYGGIDGIGNIYDQSGAQELIKVTESFTIPSEGASYTVNHSGTVFYYDEGVSYQGTYSEEVDDFGSDGPTTISGFTTMPMEKTVGIPGPLEYTCSSTGTYEFSAEDAGKVVSINYTYAQNQTDDDAKPPADVLQLSTFLGSRPQSPWGYLDANYPDHALSYPGLVMLADENLDLGSSASVPTYNFECLNGGKLAFGSGIMDCDPARLVETILTDPFIGAQFPWLGNLDQFSKYCVANGIFFSPYYDTAQAANQVVGDLIKLANSEAFWSWDGLLKIVPYGDTTVIGFGRTFTPNTQPLYDFTIDDFISDGNDDPLQIDLPDLADNSNFMKIEFRNRGNSYNVDQLSDLNQSSIQQIGLRPADTLTAHCITTPNVAQVVLNAQLTRRSYPYRPFHFKLNQCYPHLEKMDVVTVTHPNPAYGITRWPVRITELEEDDSRAELSVTAEDFPWGAGQPAVFSRTPGGGGGKPGREYPGSISAPVIFEPMDRMFRSGSPEIWIGVCGQSENWGGCEVWMSTDGSEYKPIGEIANPGRVGKLHNSVSAVSDPDTTSSFDIAMQPYATPLISATSGAADELQTLSLIDNELIAYSTVTETTSSGVVVSRLSGRTRRGVFGTTIAAHGSNARFLRLDDTVLSYAYDSSLVGKTLYFKFPSYNLIGQMRQALADVASYEFLLTGSFGNRNETILNNLVIDSVVNGSTADVRIYLAGSSVGTSGTFTRGNGSSLTAPASTLTGKDFTTTYYVAFSPEDGDYTAFTDYAAYQLHLSYGWIGVGSVTTVASDGSGGATGGGGTGGTGVHISISPSSATIAPSGSADFVATVTGSSNTDVTWTRVGIKHFNCTLTHRGNTATFTANSSTGITETIQATSVADTTVTATATVSW